MWVNLLSELVLSWNFTYNYLITTVQSNAHELRQHLNWDSGKPGGQKMRKWIFLYILCTTQLLTCLGRVIRSSTSPSCKPQGGQQKLSAEEEQVFEDLLLYCALRCFISVKKMHTLYPLALHENVTVSIQMLSQFMSIALYCIVLPYSVTFWTHSEIIPVGQFFRRWILPSRVLSVHCSVDWLIDWR